jgi:hypothetical protein
VGLDWEGCCPKPNEDAGEAAPVEPNRALPPGRRGLAFLILHTLKLAGVHERSKDTHWWLGFVVHQPQSNVSVGLWYHHEIQCELGLRKLPESLGVSCSGMKRSPVSMHPKS